MVTFVYIIEPGELEKQTLLSIYSLRYFAGKYKDAPIFCFCPRPNLEISTKTKKWLKDFKVEYINSKYNSIYSYYPIANKPLCCAEAEKICSTDLIVFMDSDTIIINEPSFLSELNFDIRIGKVVVQNVGTIGIGSKNYDLWKKLYENFNINPSYRTSTLSSNNEIFGYWNSGVVSVKKEKNIFTEWKKIFSEVVDKKLYPKGNIYFTDQITLALTVEKLQLNLKELSSGDNYHISAEKYLLPKYRANKLNDINIIHYHHIFKFSDFGNPISGLLGSDDKSKWLIENLKTFNLYPLPIPRQVRNLLGNYYHKYFK